MSLLKPSPLLLLTSLVWLLLADHFIAGNFTDLISTQFNTVMWWLALGLIANIIDSTLADTSRRMNQIPDRFMEKERTTGLISR